MFTERKINCVYLLLFAFLPFIDQKDKAIIKPWIFSTGLLFIFPFLPDHIKDSLFFM
jgi:hypothetical protein